MRITSEAISNRIHFKLGIPHIKVFPNYGKGYCFFYSDHEPTAEWLSLWYSTSVDVVALNRLSLDEWVQSFKDLMPKVTETTYTTSEGTQWTLPKLKLNLNLYQ